MVTDRLPDHTDYLRPSQPYLPVHVSKEALEGMVDKGGMDVLGLDMRQQTNQLVRVLEDVLDPYLPPDPLPGPD